MDDIVKQAMAKWPNVPACAGWLGLGARGDWYLRDAAAQAAGPFAGAGSSAASRGSRVEMEKLCDFIGRNYEADADGRWYFQNGPQRVFVELERAPWVLRLKPPAESQAWQVWTHTGRQVQAGKALHDAEGHLYLVTDAGLGMVHTQDMTLAADALEAGCWPLDEVDAAELPRLYGYVRSPQATGI